MQKIIRQNNGTWFLLTQTDDEITLTPLEDDKAYSVTGKTEDVRTVQQNRAIHLYCKKVSDLLNDRDLGVTAVLKPEVMFSMMTVKEQLFKPILSALTGKKSTTKMTSKDISNVFDVMNKTLSEKFGISVDFPSQESLNFEQNYKEK